MTFAEKLKELRKQTRIVPIPVHIFAATAMQTQIQISSLKI